MDLVVVSCLILLLFCTCMYIFETRIQPIWFPKKNVNRPVSFDTPTKRTCLKCSFPMYKNARMMEFQGNILVGCLVCGFREWIPKAEAEELPLQPTESLFTRIETSDVPIKKEQ